MGMYRQRVADSARLGLREVQRGKRLGIKKSGRQATRS